MSIGSKIEWTEATWNPTTGCTPVSPGCLNCYAARDAVRMAGNPNPKISSKYAGLAVIRDGRAVFNGAVRCHEDRLEIPLRRRKPTMYFVDSQSDLFHEDVPVAFIAKTLAVMARTPDHTYQVLTKRPERAAEVLPRAYEWISPDGVAADPLKNLWLGTSVENQATADERIPHLLRCPAAFHFLSVEPLLERIELETPGPYRQSTPERISRGFLKPICGVGGRGIISPGIDWVIVGGESGPSARPSRLEWQLSIVEQCRAAGVPAFWKQWGSRVRLGYYHEHDALRERVLDMRHKVIVPTREGGEYEHDIDRDGQPPLQSLIEAYPSGKGGDWSEWPEDLRVREMPEVRS